MILYLNRVAGSDGSDESKVSSIVRHFVSKEEHLRHGKIGLAKDYQGAVQVFLKDNGLGH